MKKIFLSFGIVLVLGGFAGAQQFSTMAVVIFADGKYYHSKVLSEAETTLRVQFIPSNSIYEFNKQGLITKSTGKYKAGTSVKFISLHDFVRDVYNEENASYPYNFYGVRFSDGQLYFALADEMKGNKLPNTFFVHSGSVYQFAKQGGKWKVEASTGAYPAGHVIKELYMVQNFGRPFYNNGSYNGGSFLGKKPTGSDN